MEHSVDFIWPELHGPWRKLSKSFKLAFLSVCLIGSITHIYIFSNLILNHDSVWRLYYDNNNLPLGRWSLQFFSEISTRFQLPVVAAVISILMLALSAALTVRFLDISNKVSIVLVSGFIASFPPAACIFSYMFTADAYFIGLFFSVLAAFCLKKYRFGGIPFVILLAVSCGIYQPFICYAIGLLLADCIIRLFSEEALKTIVRDGLRYIALIIIALVGYYAVANLLLTLQHKTFSDYQNVDSFSIWNLKEFLSQLPVAYQKYLVYFFHSSYLTDFFQAIQVCFLGLSLAALIYLVFSAKIYKDSVRLLLLTAGVLLLPMALDFITVLSAGAWVHELMLYSFVLQFALSIKAIESALKKLIVKNSNNWPILYLANIFLAALLIWNNFCVCNTAYLRLQVCYENSFALANRIVSRIESLDGYAPDIPVAIIGEASPAFYGNTVPQFSQFNSLTGTNDVLLFTPEPHIRTRRFIEHYIGIHMPKPGRELLDMLDASEEVKSIPSYPAEGSVVMYNNIIIVKLSEGAAL